MSIETDRLIRALGDSDRTIRTFATSILKMSGDPRAAAPLKALQDDVIDNVVTKLAWRLVGGRKDATESLPPSSDRSKTNAEYFWAIVKHSALTESRCLICFETGQGKYDRKQFDRECSLGLHDERVINLDWQARMLSCISVRNLVLGTRVTN